jgi:hypothetical protein
MVIWMRRYTATWTGHLEFHGLLGHLGLHFTLHFTLHFAWRCSAKISCVFVLMCCAEPTHRYAIVLGLDVSDALAALVVLVCGR